MYVYTVCTESDLCLCLSATGALGASIAGEQERQQRI